jgi:hypothetical protein
MKLPIPKFMFEVCFFGGILILVAGGVQYQVSRKQRTSFNDQMYIEDAKTGKDRAHETMLDSVGSMSRQGTWHARAISKLLLLLLLHLYCCSQATAQGTVCWQAKTIQQANTLQ